MEYNKEILSDKEYYSLIKETITEVGNSITATLGPDGRTRIIKDRDGNYYITKDGVSVLKAIAFINPAKNIITTIIKEVADKTVKQAGDGTTTSILFAQFFILKGIEFLEKGMSFNEIKKELEELEEYVLNKIKEGTKKIKGDREELIRNITRVSSNNDESIINLVSEAFKYSNNIKILEDLNLKDNIQKENGYVIERKNKSVNQNIEDGTYENLNVVMINSKLTSFSKELSRNIDKEKTNIIIAHSFNSYIVEKVYNYNLSTLYSKIILIEAPGMSEFKELLMGDIVNYCNLKKEKDFYLGGNELKVKVDFNKIVLISPKNDKMSERIKYLENAIKNTSDEVSKHSLMNRLERLQTKAVTLNVGGESNIESKERKDRVEDAVLAVNCALEEGYLPGGGKFMRDLYKGLQDNYFSDIFLIPSKKLEENGTDLSKVSDDIIDPSKVTRTAFKNAISVAKTLLSTSSLITSPYEIRSK